MNPSSSSTCSKRKRDPNSFDDEPESSCKRPKNDVIISYSFEDIGKTFISHLRAALIRNSFAISDHTMLPVGQDMRLELLKAIEESEMYIVVFSPHYASSVRNLDELVDIMDSSHKLDERKVVPVFYKVEPSDVRSQQGPFIEAFQAHHTDTNLDPERVKRWRHALKEVGQLSGLPLQHGDEAKFILEIVDELEKMQRPQELHVTDHPIGIGSRAKELISTLRLDQKDRVLVVAVFGFGGIGKTTVVKEAFNRIAPSFDLSCFLADIHYICQAPSWKVKLPKALISCLTHEKRFSIMSNHNEGVTKIRRLVSRRKVLLVLDDVDNFQQLESLGIYPKWFYEGSRIIVTTRDKRSLGSIPYVPYQTMLLNRRESLNLFIRLMFARDDPINTTFIEEVVGHAGGIPLVLKVWSSHFKQYEKEKWPSILETLKGIPHGDVQKQLQLSYDSLTPRLKKLFLDIACFFDGMKKDTVVKVLQDEDLRFFPNNEIQYLVDKSLVEITSNNEVWMRHAIREMGLEIVRQENEDEPGQRTRLWDERDVMRVLTECSGTDSVESIAFCFEEDMLEVTMEAFRKMSKLRLIKVLFYEDRIDDWCVEEFMINDEMSHLCFKKLKYMSWDLFPFKSLDNIEMCNVVVLDLRKSKLETFLEGMKSLKKLRILNVSASLSLTKTGNFSGLENLEELHFNGCENLKELHSSIGDLQKLAILDLGRSMPVKRIPWEMIGKLPSLQKLSVGTRNYDDNVESFSDEGDDPTLYPFKEGHVTPPDLIGCNLASLKHLSLYRTKFSSHCDSLLQLHQLSTIELRNCRSIQSIPNLPANVTSIKVIGCSSLVNLPYNISELKSLTILKFYYCPELGSEGPHFLMKVTGLTNLTRLSMIRCSVSQVSIEIGNLVSLKKLHLSSNPFCSLHDTLSNLSQLLNLEIEGCYQLRMLPLLPPNLKHIDAHWCDSLDVTSSASLLTKVNKESPFSNRLMIQLPWRKELLEWCTYQNRGYFLSFVAPLHLHNNICGIILCATPSERYISIISNPKMHNKTKNTSHSFKVNRGDEVHNCMLVMSCPLDDTTLLVEPGEFVVIEFPQGSLSSCGLRLIYESDVVDGYLVVKTATEPTPHIPSETGVTQLHTISIHSQCDDYSFSVIISHPMMKIYPRPISA
ncbi:TMV resistance protein N-like isoform X1 [Bidens hawaiensis]|uniref:TMV resistance protein N-like isoform X1 n=1 Tax=Bidens hawaiensis TaxID=980011 RepID=UPI004048F22B